MRRNWRRPRISSQDTEEQEESGLCIFLRVECVGCGVLDVTGMRAAKNLANTTDKGAGEGSVL